MLNRRTIEVVLLFLVMSVGLFLVSGCEPSGPITYSLTMQVDGQGSTDPSVGTYTYDEGTVVDITATPSSGWEFKEWVGDVANRESAKTTVVMNKNQTVSAVFVEKEDPVVQYTLTMQVDGQGSTDPSVGTYTYDEGTVVNITATPSSGWEFKEWLGDVENPNHSSTTITMNSHQTVTAVFSAMDAEMIRLRDLGPEGDLQDPNNVYTIIDNTNLGYWSVSLLQSRLPGDLSKYDTYTLTINENNYAFTVNPFNNDMFEVNVRDIYTIEEVRDGIFETGPPSELQEYTLTIQVDGQGSTVPSVGTHTYDEGTVVNITATPSSGWEFKEWLGDVDNPDDSSTTITIDRHQTVTAVFSAMDSEMIRLRDLGPEGDLQDPNNVYTIIDNTNLGYWSVSLLQSRLPGDLSKYDTYTLTINENNYAFTVNPFNNDMFEVNVRDIYTIEEVRDGIFKTGPPLELQEYTLTIQVDGQGSTDPSVGTHTYDEGTVVDITATPSSGWEFKEWVGEVVDAGSSSTTVMIDKDKIVRALFEKEEDDNDIEYTISGRIKDLEDQGIPNVIISFTGGFSSVTTDNQGAWSKSGLTGTVTVTPNIDGYTFAPSNQEVFGSSNKVHFIGLPVTEQTDGESIIIKDSVKPMTKTEAENIQSFSPVENRLVFRERTEYVDSLREGDILLSDPRDGLPFGLIHRVISLSDDGLTCMVEDATLEEVIEEGDLIVSHSFTFEEFVEGMVIAEGVTIQEVDFGDHKIKFERTLGDEEDGLGKISGFIRLHSTVDFDTDISYLRLRLNSFKFIVTVDFELDMNYEGKKEKEMKTSYDIIEFRSPPVPIFTGVWMTPSILFRVGAEAKLEAGMEWGLNYGRTYKGGVEYDRIIGFDSILQQSGDGFQVKRVSLEGKAEALAFGGMQVGFFVWGSAGVAAGIFGYGHAEGKVEMDDKDWSYEYDVSLGVKIASKAKLKIARIADLTYDGPELDLYRLPIVYGVSGKTTVELEEEDDPVGVEDVILEFEYKEPDHQNEWEDPTEVKTNEEGFWIKDLLTREVSVTPKKDGFSFTPEKVEVDRGKSDVDFLAQPMIPHLEELQTNWRNPPFIVTIKGKDFLDEQNGSQVFFGELEAEVLEWSDTEIRVEAPTNLPPAQSVDIIVILGVHKELPGGFEELQSNSLEWKYPPVFILPPRSVAGGWGEYTHTFEALILVEPGTYRFVWDFDDWREEADDTFVHVGESSTVSYTYSVEAPIAIMWSVYPTVKLYTTGGEFLGEDSIEIWWATF